MKKTKTSEDIQAEIEAFKAAGGTVTVCPGFVPVPRQQAKVAPKKMSLKQVAKKWRESFYGPN